MQLPLSYSSKCLVIAAVICLAPCYAGAGERLLVYTVNYPLQYFAQRIAGAHAQVEFPAPADVDPALWAPDEETIRHYRKADLILRNGAGYAQWLDKVSLPRKRQVNTSAFFAATYIPLQAGGSSQGSGDERSRAGWASTTWLDFFQAAQQAEAVLEALSKKRPEHQAEFERNYAALKQDLLALDLEVQRLVANQPDTPLFVSHPVYQYLARRYLLHLQSVTWEADVMPAEDEWEQLAYAQEAFLAQWMLWAEQPNAEISDRLQSMGIAVALFRPCGNRPQQGDFLDVMRHNIDNLKRVFADSQ